MFQLLRTLCFLFLYTNLLHVVENSSDVLVDVESDVGIDIIHHLPSSSSVATNDNPAISMIQRGFDPDGDSLFEDDKSTKGDKLKAKKNIVQEVPEVPRDMIGDIQKQGGNIVHNNDGNFPYGDTRNFRIEDGNQQASWLKSETHPKIFGPMSVIADTIEYIMQRTDPFKAIADTVGNIIVNATKSPQGLNTDAETQLTSVSAPESRMSAPFMMMDTIESLSGQKDAVDNLISASRQIQKDEIHKLDDFSNENLGDEYLTGKMSPQTKIMFPSISRLIKPVMPMKLPVLPSALPSHLMSMAIPIPLSTLQSLLMLLRLSVPPSVLPSLLMTLKLPVLPAELPSHLISMEIPVPMSTLQSILMLLKLSVPPSALQSLLTTLKLPLPPFLLQSLLMPLKFPLAPSALQPLPIPMKLPMLPSTLQPLPVPMKLPVPPSTLPSLPTPLKLPTSSPALPYFPMSLLPSPIIPPFPMNLYSLVRKNTSATSKKKRTLPDSSEAIFKNENSKSSDEHRNFKVESIEEMVDDQKDMVVQHFKDYHDSNLDDENQEGRWRKKKLLAMNRLQLQTTPPPVPVPLPVLVPVM